MNTELPSYPLENKKEMSNLSLAFLLKKRVQSTSIFKGGMLLLTYWLSEMRERTYALIASMIHSRYDVFRNLENQKIKVIFSKITHTKIHLYKKLHIIFQALEVASPVITSTFRLVMWWLRRLADFPIRGRPNNDWIVAFLSLSDDHLFTRFDDLIAHFQSGHATKSTKSVTFFRFYEFLTLKSWHGPGQWPQEAKQFH